MPSTWGDKRLAGPRGGHSSHSFTSPWSQSFSVTGRMSACSTYLKREKTLVADFICMLQTSTARSTPAIMIGRTDRGPTWREHIGGCRHELARESDPRRNVGGQRQRLLLLSPAAKREQRHAS